MRRLGVRVPASALRHLPFQAPGGVFLQEARILPQLWGAQDG
jgi:hypothetical protein